MADEEPLLNPLYLAYCRAHKLTPAQMRDKDDEEWPGASMLGFIRFVKASWDAFVPHVVDEAQWKRGGWTTSEVRHMIGSDRANHTRLVDMLDRKMIVVDCNVHCHPPRTS